VRSAGRTTRRVENGFSAPNYSGVPPSSISRRRLTSAATRTEAIPGGLLRRTGCGRPQSPMIACERIGGTC
jgi:hypothetical protein